MDNSQHHPGRVPSAGRRVRRGLVALALTAGIATVTAAATPAEAATCFTPDTISATSYVGGLAVSSEYGAVHYSSRRRGSYWVTVSDLRRDGYGSRVWVQFKQVGQSYWKDRVYIGGVGDGGSRTLGWYSFSKGYDIASVSFGVGRIGASQITIAWDRNSPCGA